MLGGLPYLTPLQVTNPHNRRTVILYKRDIGAGQPLSSTLDGYHYRLDLTAWAEQQLGLAGVSDRADHPGSTVRRRARRGPECSTPRPPGQYVNPFADTRNLIAQRIDMGVDYDGTGSIDASVTPHHLRRHRHRRRLGLLHPHNGGIVYQLTDGPDPAATSTSPKTSRPRQGRPTVQRHAGGRSRPSRHRRKRVHRDRVGLRPVPLPNRAR